ncbi:uncharacterized protein RAG0_13633 [Rhynchosporium agropyri]|uniref:Adenylate kinase n=1 Tax=Rhynchosporium agropyri TaxID=914238 RepID=A0A1E1LDN8_9HELO|nr:uncharacterized protein RAG0_13633 [Rhynchosporium agropyri]
MEDDMKAIIPHDHRLLVYILGCPGSGKGTLCKLLVQNYGYRHVSVGDLLRGLVDGEKSNPDVNIKDYVQQGTLVPTTVLLNILQPAVMPETLGSILIDGFPRSLDQGIASEDQASD